jgi:hypothetical protein
MGERNHPLQFCWPIFGESSKWLVGLFSEEGPDALSHAATDDQGCDYEGQPTKTQMKITPGLGINQK